MNILRLLYVVNAQGLVNFTLPNLTHKVPHTFAMENTFWDCTAKIIIP